MTDNKFNVEWNAAILKSKKSIEKIIREASGELFSDIILNTPVDTGALRGAWIASLNTPDSRDVGTLDKNGANTAIKALYSISNFKVGDTLYLTNNKPYAEFIEYGYSAQAPTGMVRVNIIRFNSILESVARDTK